MCEYNHSELQIEDCLISALTVRNPTAQDAELDERRSSADEKFCRSLSTGDLTPEQAREAAHELADALSDYATALLTGSAADPLALTGFFTHLVQTPFTRVIVHWEEIGLDEDQLRRVIGVARNHRMAMSEVDGSAAVRTLCEISPGEQPSRDQIVALSQIYRDALLQTIDNVVAGYELLSGDQKAKLRAVYVRETGHERD
jgi:hypothetical protein